MMRRLGVVLSDDPWQFFEHILAYLRANFEVEVLQLRAVQLPFFHERANKWLKRNDFDNFMKRNDVLFFEWASDLLVYASALPRRSAVITRLHSYELFQWAPRVHWTSVDKIILVSHAMQRAFSEHYPDQASKTSVIYNGVSLAKYNPPPRMGCNYRIGMLCNILPIKRIYEVILSFHEMKKLGSSASLHIAGKTDGDPRYAAAVRALVRKLNLQNDVHIEGFVADPHLWLRDIDVFISNSYWEGQQVALIEAMASGCYCLSHFWDGAEEVLPSDNLFITAAEMQEKILHYFELPAAAKLEQQSRMRTIACEKFDIRITAQRIREVIDESAAGARP